MSLYQLFYAHVHSEDKPMEQVILYKNHLAALAEKDQNVADLENFIRSLMLLLVGNRYVQDNPKTDWLTKVQGIFRDFGPGIVDQIAEKDKKIEHMKEHTWCAYCGYEIFIDDEAATKISEHITNDCPSHPLRIALVALAEKDKKIELLNPCNHTGFESISCEICGYPDSRKLIAALKAEIHQQFEESIAVIHDQGAENIRLKQDLTLNAQMLARQTDLAREAETEAARYRAVLEFVKSYNDIPEVDEALK